MPRGEKSGALMVEKSEALSPALVPRTSLPFGMLAAFMDFVARHGVPSLRYSFQDLEEERQSAYRLEGDHRSRFIAACYSEQAWLF